MAGEQNFSYKLGEAGTWIFGSFTLVSFLMLVAAGIEDDFRVDPEAAKHDAVYPGVALLVFGALTGCAVFLREYNRAAS
jgi:hypothetical protein